MTRHEQNRLARQRHREADVQTLDRTDPAQNPELADAIRWANVSRASRPRKPTRIDFNPLTILHDNPLTILHDLRRRRP